MFIDLHMHEMTFSKDSHLKLDEMVLIAKMRGLQGICITDHDSMGLKEYAAEYSKETGFPIFVGIEYYSRQGDIVAFGIDTYPRERLDAQTFVDEVNRQGGVCFSAHPFRNNNRGLEENLNTVKGLHGIEVLNGSTQMTANRLAAEYAERLGLAMVGSSDCHVPEMIGVYATYFPNEVRTMDEFVKAFKEDALRPACYLDGGYYIWDYKMQAVG